MLKHLLIAILLAVSISTLHAQNIQGSLKHGAFDYLIRMQIKNNGTETISGNLTSVEFTLAYNLGVEFVHKRLLLPLADNGTLSENRYWSFGPKNTLIFTGSQPITLAPGETLDIMEFNFVNGYIGGSTEGSVSLMAGLIEVIHTWSVKVDGVEASDQVNRFYNSGDMQSVVNDPQGSFGSIAFPFTPLPVVLKNFVASSENQEVNLSWTTTEEANSRSFEVQRSSDVRNWEKIGTVSAKGESKAIENYSLKDPVPGEGDNYYRLKMIDHDDTFAFSKIIVVNLANQSGIYPNPTNGTVNLRPFKNILPKSVEIFDLKGKSIAKNVNIENNKVDLSGMQRGLYVLTVIYANGNTASSRIIIE